MDELITSGSRWLWVSGVLAGAAVLGFLVYAVAYRAIGALTPRMTTRLPLRGALLRRARGPLRLLLPVIIVYAALPTVRASIPEDVAWVLDNALHVLFVGAVTWFIAALLVAIEEAVAESYSIEMADNLKARKIVTQARIMRRIATTVVVIIAVGIVLLEYEPFRELGTGILASAGIAGIVLGIAAQKTLGNVIAGIQIAFTQPIRVDDVVIVEGEFGWVEEITLTYVVVRVWDRRRVVMPITHFVDQPFQNWTRISSDLIGAVYLYVDYTTPVEDLRQELQRIVEASEHWDGDVVNLQVTDASERTITLRAIATAQSAPELWDLRCEIRERLVTFLREHHPDALPAIRTRVQEADGLSRILPEG